MPTTIELHINEKKTEYILYNQEDIEIKILSGKHLKRVEDFN